MKGVIRAKGSCPVCEGKFAEVKKLGYICPNHKTLPKRFFVDLFYKGKRLKLYSDRQGICLDTYQRAQTLLHQINSEIKNHTFDPAKYVKQEQERFYTSNLLDRFRMFKIDSLAPSYKKDFERHIRHAKNFFGAKDVRELRKLDILNYKDHLEKKFQLSNKTIKNIIDIFKTFLRYVKDDLEIISVVPGFPKIEQQPPKTTWLTPEVQQRLYESIPDEDKPIFAFLILSGCRPGEARALRCKDINLDLQIITISATFSGRVYRETRKGRGSRNATIPIHPEMLGYIKNHIENCLPSNYVFLNPRTGKYYSENTLKKIWQITKKKNNLPEGVRLYDATRHSFASQLVSRGVSLINVSRLLGHSSVKMTERYTHADLEKLKIDVENLSLRKIMTVPNVSPIANAGL
ncbi:MAG: tyrosine-type recombinase/integrase [Candidatus Kuenenia sp.]|nr:tyrosine-type recombinase/integrase [Candidatus Kuenenia hertensis]